MQGVYRMSFPSFTTAGQAIARTLVRSGSKEDLARVTRHLDLLNTERDVIYESAMRVMSYRNLMAWGLDAQQAQDAKRWFEENLRGG